MLSYLRATLSSLLRSDDHGGNDPAMPSPTTTARRSNSTLTRLVRHIILAMVHMRKRKRRKTDEELKISKQRYEIFLFDHWVFHKYCSRRQAYKCNTLFFCLFWMLFFWGIVFPVGPTKAILFCMILYFFRSVVFVARPTRALLYFFDFLLVFLFFVIIVWRFLYFLKYCFRSPTYQSNTLIFSESHFS